MDDPLDFHIDVVRTGKVAAGGAHVSVDRILAAIIDASDFLVEKIRDLTPAGATGNLRGTVQHEVRTVGEEIVSTISSNAEYALPVERGSRPHMPPLQAIIDWVHAKLSEDRANPRTIRAAGGKKAWRAQQKAQRGHEPPRGDMDIYLTAQRIRWAIYHHGTSAQAQKTVGRAGPTGGFGYFMFERALERHAAEMEARFFAPLGLEILRGLES